MRRETAPRRLFLPLKAVYFHAIKIGEKQEEYRLVTPYWTKRLVGRTYDEIVLTKGYPPRYNLSRRILRPWKGYTVKTITHPHFGDKPAQVYAIKVNP